MSYMHSLLFKYYAHAPIGSSRVENHTTFEGLGVFGCARRTERMALRPWDRGCAAPKTFRFPCRGDRKFGAPCTFKSRSRARPESSLSWLPDNTVFEWRTWRIVICFQDKSSRQDTTCSCLHYRRSGSLKLGHQVQWYGNCSVFFCKRQSWFAWLSLRE